MANIRAFIRTTKKRTQPVNVRFRLVDGRGVQIFHTSDIKVMEEHWDSDKEQIKSRVVFDYQKRMEFNNAIAERKQLLHKIYASRVGGASSEWLNHEVEKQLHPEMCGDLTGLDFFSYLLSFITKHKMSNSRKAHYQVVSRSLQRYELYRRKSTPNFGLSYDIITTDMLRDIERFLLNEPAVYAKYPDIYTSIPESRTPKLRGQNTVSGMLSKVRTFFIWSVDNGLTDSNPFRGFSISEEMYGTPYFLTIEERNRVFQTNLKHHPSLAVQRDIFIFQCMIGCRVGDLIMMMGANIINGAVEYIARKTKDERAETIRVPLNSTAKKIVQHYSAKSEEPLLPFISPQKYNAALKLIFKAARLKRMVTVVNSVTRQEEKRPLYELAASHICRRTFIGNIYNQVKDPNLIAKLSGHVEGSKAFSRYRAIDDEIKTEVVNMLE